MLAPTLKLSSPDIDWNTDLGDMRLARLPAVSFGLFDAGSAVHHRELITTQACHRIIFPDDTLETARYFAEHRVPHRMAIDVIHRLKTVQSQ